MFSCFELFIFIIYRNLRGLSGRGAILPGLDNHIMLYYLYSVDLMDLADWNFSRHIWCSRRGETQLFCFLFVLSGVVL